MPVVRANSQRYLDFREVESVKSVEGMLGAPSVSFDTRDASSFQQHRKCGCQCGVPRDNSVMRLWVGNLCAIMALPLNRGRLTQR